MHSVLSYKDPAVSSITQILMAIDAVALVTYFVRGKKMILTLTDWFCLFDVQPLSRLYQRCIK